MRSIISKVFARKSPTKVLKEITKQVKKNMYHSNAIKNKNNYSKESAYKNIIKSKNNYVSYDKKN